MTRPLQFGAVATLLLTGCLTLPSGSTTGAGSDAGDSDAGASADGAVSNGADGGQSSWRLPLTIPPTALEGQVSDFPYLVRLESNASIAGVFESAAQLRFVSSDFEPLPFEIESATPADGSLTAWVAISSDDSVIVLEIWPEAAPREALSVWDDYSLVYHFVAPDGETADDSSPNGLDGAVAGSAASAMGRVGSALKLDGSSARITIPWSEALEVQPYTLSAWVHRIDGDTSGTIFAAPLPSNDLNYWNLLVDDAGNVEAGVYSGGSWSNIQTGLNIPAETWTHVAVVFGEGVLQPYVNGVSNNERLIEQDAIDYSQYDVETALIGVDLNQSVYQGYFDGRLDEVRIASTARSPEWLMLEFDNQSEDGATVEAGTLAPP